MDASIAGAIMAFAGVYEGAAVGFISGGLLMIAGGICGIVYYRMRYGSRRPPKEDEDLLIAPIVFRDFAGLGFTRRF